MAKVKQKTVASVKSKRMKSEQSHLHFAMTSKNYMIIGIGIFLIIIGYILMDANSVDGFLPTVIAPILLVLGYCVAIPIGILLKDSGDQITESPVLAAEKIETSTVNVNVNTNIKTSK